MAISQTAQKNHDTIFPNRELVLRANDPELAELFDNFVYGEVMQYGTLDQKTRMMIILASTIAQQALHEYLLLLEGAWNIGMTPVELKEILYHAVPYCGVARVVEFIRETNRFLTDHGVALPLEKQGTTTPEDRFEKGLAVQKGIFGDTIDQMRRSAPPNQAHIQDYLSANCFGDYYTRGGLDIPARELITFSILASLGGCEPQLKGHIQGNVNVGNGKDVLLSAVTQLLPYIGYPRSLNAIQCINEVIPE